MTTLQLIVIGLLLIGASGAIGAVLASAAAANRRAELDERLSDSRETLERIRKHLRGQPGVTLCGVGRIIADCADIGGDDGNKAATVLRAFPALALLLANNPVPPSRCQDPAHAERWAEKLAR